MARAGSATISKLNELCFGPPTQSMVFSCQNRGHVWVRGYTTYFFQGFKGLLSILTQRPTLPETSPALANHEKNICNHLQYIIPLATTAKISENAVTPCPASAQQKRPPPVILSTPKILLHKRKFNATAVHLADVLDVVADHSGHHTEQGLGRRPSLGPCVRATTTESEQKALEKEKLE